MSEVLKYKGYEGSVDYCEDGKTFLGKIKRVRALVIYESQEREGLQAAFEEAVDHYIELCKDKGWDPKVGTPESALKPDSALVRRYA